MKPNQKALLWGGAIIAVGVLAILVGRGLGGTDTITTAPDASAADIVAPVSTAPASPVEDTPPWMQGPAAGGTAIARTGTGAAAAAATQADIEKSLVDLRQKSAHNLRAADEMLAQLDTLEKTGKVPPDVRLDALRNNLVIAKRAQVLALEMAESTRQGDGSKREQRNAEIVAELQQLQNQLRYDVGGGASPAATGRAQ